MKSPARDGESDGTVGTPVSHASPGSAGHRDGGAGHGRVDGHAATLRRRVRRRGADRPGPSGRPLRVGDEQRRRRHPRRGGGLSFRLGAHPGAHAVELAARHRVHRVPLDDNGSAAAALDRTQGDPARVGFALLFYVSILGHELAHAWVARGGSAIPCTASRCGVLGGFTSYERRITSAWREAPHRGLGPAVARSLIGCSWRGPCTSVADGADPRLRALAFALALVERAAGRLQRASGPSARRRRACCEVDRLGHHARREPRHRGGGVGRARRGGRRASLSLVAARAPRRPRARPPERRHRGCHLGVPVVRRERGAHAGQG